MHFIGCRWQREGLGIMGSSREAWLGCALKPHQAGHLSTRGSPGAPTEAAGSAFLKGELYGRQSAASRWPAGDEALSQYLDDCETPYAGFSVCMHFRAVRQQHGHRCNVRGVG